MANQKDKEDGKGTMDDEEAGRLEDNAAGNASGGSKSTRDRKDSNADEEDEDLEADKAE